MSRRLVLLPFVMTLAGCTSLIHADLRPLLEQQQFPVTMDDAPAGAETIGLIASRDTGFYPLGLIPVVPMSMQVCVEELVQQARALGGEGVARVTVEYEQPVSFLSFSVFFMPDWFGSITVTGSVFRRAKKS